MPKKLHDCVEKVERKGKADNPWAVCNAALKHKSAKMKHKRGKGIISGASRKR